MANSATNIGALIDSKLEGSSPSKIVAGTASIIVGGYIVARLLEPGDLFKRLDRAKWRVIRYVGQTLVDKEIKKAKAGIVFKATDSDENFFVLPEKGMPHSKVLALCNERQKTLDAGYADGGMSGTVYHGGADHTKFINDVMCMFQWSNPLHVDVFGAVRKMEAEIVAMTLKMYNGDPNVACGVVTSGGSESIAMAVKATRDWAKAQGFKTYSIVAPITKHPAFDKAANYFGLEMINVPINQTTGIVDPEVLEQYIRHDTCLIIGSAPCFPNGSIDNIPALAAIAKKRGICMHVDACLGGFIVPFLEAAGFDAPLIDFRVEGVTSISADTHKYGFAPKGTSVVMYSNRQLRSHQYFAYTEWPGGMYCSPAAAGSKPGNAIAGTWAAMVAFGREGYTESCKQICSTCQVIKNGLLEIPSIQIIGSPTACVVSFTSDRIDIFQLGGWLKTRGWHLNPLQKPSGMQFSITRMQTLPGVADRFLKDVREGTELLLAELAPGEVKDSSKGASIYASQQRVADRTIVADIIVGFLDMYYEVR